MPAYGSSARRHLDDADLLFASGRVANADHLAGFAAECALKSILCGPAGVPVPPKGAPTFQGTTFSHLPNLWTQAGNHLSGLTALSIPHLAQLLSSANPFGSWDVGDRYEDANAIAQPRAHAHLVAAQQLLGIVQQVALSGMALA